MMPEDVKEVEKFAESVMLAAQDLRKAAIALETAEDWIAREPLSYRAKKQHLNVSATYAAAKLAMDKILSASNVSLKSEVSDWISNARAKWVVLPRTKALDALERIVASH